MVFGVGCAYVVTSSLTRMIILLLMPPFGVGCAYVAENDIFTHPDDTPVPDAPPHLPYKNKRAGTAPCKTFPPDP